MTAITDLFRFAVDGGFWRFAGVAFLVAIVCGGVREVFAATLAAIHRGKS